jgi:hypothetical protein
VAQAIECLLSKYKALSSKPQPPLIKCHFGDYVKLYAEMINCGYGEQAVIHIRL